VIIYRLDLIDFTSPLVTIDVECGGGTYVRSLAHDLGQALGVGGHLKSLRRTRYGEFDIKDAVALDNLKSADDVAAALLPVDVSLHHLPLLVLDEDSTEKVSHGVLPNEFLSQMNEGKTYRLYRPDGELLAVIDAAPPEVRLKVFGAPQPADDQAEQASQP
jgi:tRNA pseudouridine55 synthase